jgi:hypothetical protein
MPHKVHVIEADLSGSLPHALAERENLGQQIVKLSQSMRETVWFHEYKSDMLGGAPTIMLECSDSFLGMVRMLPSYKADREASHHPGLETERSAKLQHYYSSGGAAGRTGPDCKMLPPPGLKPPRP